MRSRFAQVACHPVALQAWHAAWVKVVTAQVESVQGWQSARLLAVDTEEGGQLRIFFSSTLVTVLTEARQLRSLGLHVPRGVERELKVRLWPDDLLVIPAWCKCVACKALSPRMAAAFPRFRICSHLRGFERWY